MSASFASELASRRQKIFMLGIAAGLVAVAVFTMTHVGLPLAPIPAFLPFYAGIVVVTDGLTAYLFATQFRIAPHPPTAILGAAYLYSSMIIVPQMLTFPHLVTESGLFGAGSQSAVWLWVFWHGGFPTFILAYALSRGRLQRVRIGERAAAGWGILSPLLVLSLVVALTALVTLGHDRLPVLVKVNDFTSLSQSKTAFVVMALNAAALAAVVLATRLRSVGDLGLTLALLASLLDAILTLNSGARFSLGWYVARVNSMISGGAVLAVFLYEIGWLYHRLVGLNDSLSRLAFVDELTGLANRRQFDQRLEQEWGRAQRDGTPLALVLLDVDFFKKFNDRYGHQAGDACLRQVGRAIAGTVRRSADLCARYGGEEFVLVLPNTLEPGAQRVADLIGAAIQQLAIRHEAGTDLGVVTVSLGVAVARPSDGNGSPELLTSRADEALYAAKAAGRRRCVLAGAPVGAVALSQ